MISSLVSATKTPITVLLTVQHTNTQESRAEQRQMREANRAREIEYARNRREIRARGEEFQLRVLSIQ